MLHLRIIYNTKGPIIKQKLLLLVPVSALIMLVFTGCYDHPNQKKTDQQEIVQTGQASWYGPGFHGRLTSNRERFNQNELTAAHRTLPFNSIVKVVNTENDETVEVRINDRGPYAHNRVIDLSKAAADAIGMTDDGVARVELVLVEAGGPLPENLNRPTFTIQLGEYNLESYAGQFADDVGEGVRVEQRFPRGSERAVYMIYYGSYTTFGSANADLKQLRERGFEGFIRQID